MRSVPSFEEIKVLIVASEGNKSFMYLDSKGYVTVGIGNMLPSAAVARELRFITQATGYKATTEEIDADYASVAAQKKGKSANFYRSFTKLDLPDVEVNDLFRSRVAEFQTQLRRVFPKYDSYPSPAQLALLDMVFNMGTGSLRSKFPKMTKSVQSEDWATAATECHRPESNPVRNATTEELFQQAAKSVAKAGQ